MLSLSLPESHSSTVKNSMSTLPSMFLESTSRTCPFPDSPFRARDPKTMSLSWQPVKKMRPDMVYEQGSIKEFEKLTGWKGPSVRVLYIGDHVYSDLAVRDLHI